MKHTTPSRWLAILLSVNAALLSTAIFAQTPMFTVQVLGNVPGGAGGTVYGINNAGEAVGIAEGSSSAVIWRDLKPTLLGQVAVGSIGYSINSAGQVGGLAFASMSVFYPIEAVVWSSGTPSVLTAPGPQYTNTNVASINDAGQAVGTADIGDVGTGSAAVVWNGSTPTVLGLVSGYTAASASGINDSGLIVGFICCAPAMEPEAVVWHGTIPTLLPKLEPSNLPAGKAVAVNNSGLVVGQAETRAQDTHAVAWFNGVITDMGTLSGGSRSYATAVNNRGIIVGNSDTVDTSQPHATLWSRIAAVPQDLNLLISAGAAKQIKLTAATGINDHCAIVANGIVKQTSVDTAFLLTLTDPSLCVNGL
jgi:probable HAF family extracellular repeat protein